MWHERSCAIRVTDTHRFSAFLIEKVALLWRVAETSYRFGYSRRLLDDETTS
jgi:hypothetical protein